MKVKSLAALALVLLVIGAMAVAQSAPLKLVPYKLNGPAYPKASGSLTLTYDAQTDLTTLSGEVTGLARNRTYTLYLYAPKVGFHHGATLKTDANGMGTIKATMKGNHSEHLPAVVNDDGRKVTVLNSI